MSAVITLVRSELNIPDLDYSQVSSAINKVFSITKENGVVYIDVTHEKPPKDRKRSEKK